MAELRVEIAYPARTKTAFGSSEADMFGSNADIYDAVSMSVIRTYPFFVVTDATDDDALWGVEPVARIALTYFV